MATPTTNFNLLKPATGETYDVALLDSNYDKIDAGIHNPSSSQTLLSLGLMAEADDVTGSGPSSAIQVIQNIASFTFKANRRYLVEWEGTVENNTANTICLAQIQTCSTADAANLTTGLTEIRGSAVPTAIANAVIYFCARRHIKYSADTTLQIKGTIAPQVGGGSVTFGAGATWPGQLTITDEGMQF
jgi:hypothetical protein